MQLLNIFKKISDSFSADEVLFFKLDDGSDISLSLRVQPSKDIDEVQEDYQNNLISLREVNEIIFVHTVVALNDIFINLEEKLNLKVFRDSDVKDPDVQDLLIQYPNVDEISYKEILKKQASVMPNKILEAISLIYHKKIIEINNDRVKYFKNKHIDQLFESIKRSQEKATELKEMPVESVKAEQKINPETPLKESVKPVVSNDSPMPQKPVDISEIYPTDSIHKKLKNLPKPTLDSHKDSFITDSDNA